MKLIKLISLSRHHANLCDKVGWYSKWHEHPYHKHVHWLTFSIFVLISGIVVYNSYVLKPGFVRADKHDEKIVAELADEEKKDDKKDNGLKEEEKEGKEEKEGDKEKKDKEEKSEEIIIPNIEEIADFIEEQAENINEININAEEPEEEDLEEEESDEEEELDEDEEPAEVEEEEEEDLEEENEEPPVVPSPAEENEEPPIEEPAVIPTIPASSGGGGVGSAIPVFGTATVLDVTSPIRNNKYRTGPMPIYVIFSKPVEVIGSPVLAIATGNPSETLIDYRGGSGTDTLAFTYKIASTNFSSDLDYVSTDSLFLNGGSIKDIDGNDASILLPAPGSTHSLGANKDIAIDTIIRKPTMLAPPVL